MWWNMDHCPSSLLYHLKAFKEQSYLKIWMQTKIHFIFDTIVQTYESYSLVVLRNVINLANLNKNYIL